ncbi:MAG: amino acid permease [Alphaproteobacteria bacterium]|nr:amino acid permease [Alphaproteobacteria bacterium]
MASSSGSGHTPGGDTAEDVKTLHGMGYAQELLRRMGGFSNFAISFSIICILSGGINSVAQGVSGVGGGALGIGWIVGCALTMFFALGMGQIASAYPTAGGLYHWGSILGGRWWGWVTAWLNLLGLITVLGAINVGTYYFFIGSFAGMLGIEPTFATQVIFMIIVTGSQALFNHLGIKLTTKLTDFSGYLILFGAAALALVLLAFAPSWDFSRLVTFTNYSGDAGGGVWPQSDSLIYLFLLGLLLPIYTITGYDASAHTSEETVGASRNVPRGMIHSVLWSGLFGWLFLSAFVLAIPDMNAAAAQGWNVFFWTMDQVVPSSIKNILYLVILVSQYLCGLATVTSASRMIFAFSRDGGLPFSGALKKVSPTYRTPVAAIWVAAALAVLFTAYTPIYSTIVSVTVIFLYISYGVPIALGLLAYKKTWTKMGPWDLGGTFRIVAVMCILIDVLIFYIGVQPPNDKALWITAAFVAITLAVWFGLEQRRFQGPPIGDQITKRQVDILAAEKAVGEKAQ